MTQTLDVQSYLPAARDAARGIKRVFINRELDPRSIKSYVLTAHDQNVWLIAVINDDRDGFGRQEKYIHPNVAHQIETSLDGKPTFLSNHIGVHYAVLLSEPPSLPDAVEYPGWQPGRVQLGVGFKGPVMLRWPDLGHIWIGGETRWGKTNCLRLILDQAVAEGFGALVIDPKGQFPSLTDNPALLADIGFTPDDACAILQKPLVMMSERAALFAASRVDDLNIDRYNKLHPDAPLPRVVVAIDEFNSMVEATGGPRGFVVRAVTQIAWQGLGLGIHLVFAGHEFTAKSIGPLRDHVRTRICLRVARPTVSQMVVGKRGAETIQVRGRALSTFGPLQIYHMAGFTFPADGVSTDARSDDSLGAPVGNTRSDASPSKSHGRHGAPPVDAPTGIYSAQITREDVPLIVQLVTQYRGRMTYAALGKMGYDRTKAEVIRNDWEKRGLAAVFPDEDNALCVVPELAQLAREAMHRKLSRP